MTVISFTKQNQERPAKEIGIQPSLTVEDAKACLEQVIKEVEKPETQQ